MFSRRKISFEISKIRIYDKICICFEKKLSRFLYAMYKFLLIQRLQIVKENVDKVYFSL